MKKLLQLSGLCMSALFAMIHSANAGTVLAPTSILSNTLGQYSTWAPTKMIDQSGLSVGYTNGVTDWDAYVAADPTHPSSSYNDSYGWASENNNIVTGTIVFDLGASYTLSTFALWSDNDDQSVGHFSWDISDDLSFSTFSSLGSFSATYMSEPIHAQLFNLTAGTGRYVRWNITDTVAGSYNLVQAGEIAFDATPASTPDSGNVVVLLGGALLGLAALRRKFAA